MTYRAMFGGYELYCGRVFFGGDHKDRLYFRTNATTAPRFREREMMKPFRPGSKQGLSTHCEVPVDFLEDAAQRTTWAQLAGNL
jgi:TfoX/Sxy family transcriptional regulator of competence genes